MVRLARPIRLLVTLSLLLAASGAPLAGQAAERLRIDLNIPAMRLTVYEGNRVLERYPVAVGQPGHQTPVGTYTISHAEWNPWWRPPAREWARGEKITPPGPTNPMGRAKLFFAPLYYVHGTPERESLGSPASHGCVRMLNEDVVELARLLHDRAGATVPASEIDRILARSRETRVSHFQDSITFVVRYSTAEVEDGHLVVYPDVYRRTSARVEAVYQALLRAGYDVRGVERERVAAVLEEARRAKGVYRVPVSEAFGALERGGG